jgi:hypothetical protein
VCACFVPICGFYFILFLSFFPLFLSLLRTWRHRSLSLRLVSILGSPRWPAASPNSNQQTFRPSLTLNLRTFQRTLLLFLLFPLPHRRARHPHQIKLKFYSHPFKYQRPWETEDTQLFTVSCSLRGPSYIPLPYSSLARCVYIPKNRDILHRALPPPSHRFRTPCLLKSVVTRPTARIDL